MNNAYTIKANDLIGRLAFLKLAVRMLLIPRSTYSLQAPAGFQAIVMPAATLHDVLTCLKVGFWHSHYGYSKVVDGRILLPSEWENYVWLKGGAA